MFKRKKMSKFKSKRLFTKGAKRIHRKNSSARPMRGGFRI